MTDADIQVLLAGGIPGEKKEDVTLTETHISWVLLGSECVYKIKKPLQFSFLDFSSLEKRLHYCRRELELNRRLTTGVYLDVLPVVRRGKAILISANEDGTGETIDYALKMKRLDTDRQMDRLLQQQRIAPEELDPLARTIADFHRKAQRSPSALQPGEIQKDFADLTKIKDYLQSRSKEDVGDLLDRSLDLSARFLYRHEARFQERWEAGLVIDGHGDFHSRNIFLLDPPVIFDCIEFNDHYRYIDVLDEIAFLCMDLDYFGRADLHDYFLRRYLRYHPAVRSAEDQQLFAYFKWYRANIRLKVDALAAKEKKTEDLQQRVARYLDLFKKYYSFLQHGV